MRTLKTVVCTLALALSANVAMAQWGTPDTPGGLKDAYKDYFKIGVAVNQGNINNPKEIELILKEYNSITAENDMKPGELHPAEGWHQPGWQHGFPGHHSPPPDRPDRLSVRSDLRLRRQGHSHRLYPGLF